MCADALAGSLLFSPCYLGVVFYMVVCGVCVRVCVCVRACMCVCVWVGAMCTLGAWSPSGWVVGIPWVYFTTQTLPTSVGKTRPHRGSSTRPPNGSISVESESRDFRPDPDRLVIVRCLVLASCPLPFSLSYSLHSFPNRTTLLSSPSNDDYELRQQQLPSPPPSFPLSKTTPLHSFQHRLHQYPRPTSLEPNREGWAIVDVLFVLGRGAPLVSYILPFSDHFYYILVHVVVTGSYVAQCRHPDP